MAKREILASTQKSKQKPKGKPKVPWGFTMSKTSQIVLTHLMVKVRTIICYESNNLKTHKP